MPRMTSAELAAYEARRQPQHQPVTRNDQREAELHADILNECRRRGWLVFHGSMAHKTKRTPGEPDFVILADLGRTLFVECKTGTGKLSSDQLGIAAWANKLGHTVHVVRSLAEFLEVVKLTQKKRDTVET